MLESERKRLFSWDEKYLSIGINEGGTVINTMSVVWRKFTNAQCMDTPKIYIAPEDLRDSEIMDKIKSFEVVGCYIWTPLEDYDFLAEFPRISDISIRCDSGIRNIDFLKNLRFCRMLMLSGARLKNLDVIAEKKKKRDFVFDLSCLCLYDCVIEDISSISNPDFYFSEFLVCNPKARDERERWAASGIKGFGYYFTHQ